MSTRRDYKSDTTWKTRTRVRRQGMVVIALVLIGLVGGLIAYVGGGKGTDIAPSQPVEDKIQQPVSASKPLDFSPSKPKYDFYQVLPERELVIGNDELSKQSLPRKSPPKENSSVAKKPTPKAQPPVTSKLPPKAPVSVAKPAAPARTKTVDRYIVQAGSFRNFADADRLKASLAFLGIRAYIQAGTSGDGSKLHRVRIGPVTSKKADALQKRLRENDIKSIALKAN